MNELLHLAVLVNVDARSFFAVKKILYYFLYYLISVATQLSMNLASFSPIPIAIILYNSFSISAWAQLIPDGSTITTIGNCHAQCRIEGRTSRGRTLFHSFQELNVNRKQEVRFVAPEGINNILVRVTGDNPSRIRGLLGVTSQANLMLLNPNGIIFGPHAQLDIRGSFLATTSNRFILADGNEFSANNRHIPPLLTVNVPIGLQFSPSSQQIESSANLRVGSGETLALLGNGIFVRGGELLAKAGRVEIASLAEGQVYLNPIQSSFTPSYGQAQDFQDVRFENRSGINTSGPIGGSIQIYGRDISLTEHSRVTSTTFGAGTGRDLSINAENTLSLSKGASIGTNTQGAGNAGNVFIRASNTIYLAGSSTPNDVSSIYSQVCFSGQNCERATGNSGDLFFTTNYLSIHSGSNINTITLGSGRGGDISIRASEIELAGAVAYPVEENQPPSWQSAGIFAQTFNGTGNAGDVKLNIDSLTLEEGAQINTSTLGNGNAGRLTVQASDSTRIRGFVGDLSISDGFIESGLFASSEFGAKGNAGQVSVQTRNLILENGGAIAARNFSNGGGGIEINADRINLDSGRITAFSVGGVGTIRIDNFTLLTMRNSFEEGTRISASSKSGVDLSADAGNVLINAPSGVVIAAPDQDNDIIAGARQGRGGRIDITAQGILNLAEGVSVDSNNTNDIDASSDFGQSGVVTLNSAEINSSPTLPDLPAIPIRSELSQGCQVEGRQATASFFHTGRGGTLPNPYEPLSSHDILADLRLPDQLINESRITDNSTPPVEALGWVRNKHGDVMLVAETPTTNQAGCHLY